MRTAAYRASRLIGAFLLLSGIVGTFWFALDGARALVLGLSAALVYSLVLGLRIGTRDGFDAGVNAGFAGGVAAGLAVGALDIFAPKKLAEAETLFSVSDIFVVTLSLNFALNLVRPSGDRRDDQRKGPLDFHSVLFGAESGAWVGGLFGFLHAIVLGKGLLDAATKGALWTLGGGLCGAITAQPGMLAARWLRPRLDIFGDLMPYLRGMWVPLGGFALGYFAILFLFACLFGVAWRVDPQSFRGLPPDASFGSFLYFSLETITTLGYATIAPVSVTVRILVSIELMLGIGWITVFFAVLIAYLQPRFERIAREQQEEQEEKAAVRPRRVAAAGGVAPHEGGGVTDR
jgi:hypothetical protein